MQATYKETSRCASPMKRDMRRRLEGNSTRILSSPLAAQEHVRHKRVKFSSLDTVHTFSDKSIPCPQITAKKCMSHVSVGSMLTLDGSDVTHNHVKAKKQFCNQTHISHFREEQIMEIQVKKKDHLCLGATSSSLCSTDSISDSEYYQFQTDFRKARDYAKVFNRKRKKLQDLAATALSVEGGDLIFCGSKSIVTLLQRLEAPSNSDLGTALQEGDLESSYISTGIEKRQMQSNFWPETSISLDLKYNFQKDCASFGIWSDAEEIGHTYHGNKLWKNKDSVFQHEDHLSSWWKADEVHHHSNDSYECSLYGLADMGFSAHPLCGKEQLTREIDIDHGTIVGNELLKSKASNFQNEDYFSLISSWEADEIHHYGNDSYGCSLHVLEDVDFGTHSLFTKQQLNQEFETDHENILDAGFLHCPYSLFSRICSIDYDHNWNSGDIVLPNGFNTNYKNDDFFFTKGITMQLPSHIDRFPCYRKDFCPETGMIFWTLPEENICCNLFLKNLNPDYKHHGEESVPENTLVMWDSSIKDIPMCDKIKDLCFQSTSQNFNLTHPQWYNDPEYADSVFDCSLSNMELHHRTKRWEPKESLSCFLSKERTLDEELHELLNNTDGMHMPEQ